MTRLRFPRYNYYAVTALMLLLPLLLLWLSRFVFAAYNSDLVGNPSVGEVLRLSLGGLRFDISAWAYCNVLFVVMRCLPWDFIFNRIYLIAGKIIYCLTNFTMLALALGDIPFFRFSGSRLRLPAVRDMLHDPEIGGIILSYASAYWWAFLIGFLILGVLIAACLIPVKHNLITFRKKWTTVTIRGGLTLGLLFLTFCAMRGTLGPGRPLSISDAIWYVRSTPEINVVLNTPYCVIRSVEGGERVTPMNFMSEKELAALRSGVTRSAKPRESFIRRNIVVITIESGSQHWLDNLTSIPGTEKRHLMPFLDSLASVSLVNTHVLATGKRSIEGLTAIYGGFPTFGDMLFMSSPYASNIIDAFPRLLRDEGYSTRFYFGGNHGSYSIDALAKAMGFNDVVDRDTYANDADFNGKWGIYDHAMARYAALDMSTLKEPFVTGWFTLDLHQPFNTPSDWRPDGYLHSEKGLYRSAEYTDRALRHFFETARTQPWYRNTTFIITGDHGCRDLKDTPYDTPYIQPHVMMLVYAPDGSVSPGRIDDRVMSQIDLSPTILSMLRYPRPYVALGADMTDENSPHYALGFFNGGYQITGQRYMMTTSADLRTIEKVFDIIADPLARQETTDYDRNETARMLRWAQAFMQDYTHRLNSNTLHL